MHWDGLKTMGTCAEDIWIWNISSRPDGDEEIRRPDYRSKATQGTLQKEEKALLSCQQLLNAASTDPKRRGSRQ